jgi:hypothetical protein
MADVEQLMKNCDKCRAYLETSRRFNQLSADARADRCKKFKETCPSCFELQQVLNVSIDNVHLLKPADRPGSSLMTPKQYQNMETLITDCEGEKSKKKVSKCPFSAATVQADEKALQTALNESGQYRAPRSSVGEGAYPLVEGQVYPVVSGEPAASNDGIPYPFTKWF